MRGTLLILLASLLPLSMGAYDFEANGIYYNIIGSNVLTGYTVEVTYGGQFSYSGTESYNADEVTVPATTTYEHTPCQVVGIGESAFYMCSAKKISLPEGITYISDKAFYRSTSLAEVDIADGLTTIGEQSFYLCSALDSIYLPSTVESIGFKAFGSCSTLSTVVSMNTTPPTLPTDSDGNPFDGISSDKVLYVPGNAVDAYADASIWKTFTIVGLPLTFTCVTDPADNAVLTKIENIYVYNPTDGEEIFLNDDIEEAPEVNIYDSNGDIVTTLGYVGTLSGEGEDSEKELAQVIYFGGDDYPSTITDEGTYYVTIPGDLFVIYDEEGYAYYNEAMTLTYTVAEDAVEEPTYTLTITPESGSTVDALATISIACDDGIAVNIVPMLMPDDEITITDGDGNDCEISYNIEENTDGVSGLVTEVVITLESAIVAAGTYYVNIPAAYFDIANTLCEALTLVYTITGSEDGIAAVPVSSEDVTSIYTLDGKQQETLHKGVNILQMSNGSTKKVLVK